MTFLRVPPTGQGSHLSCETCLTDSRGYQMLKLDDLISSSIISFRFVALTEMSHHMLKGLPQNLVESFMSCKTAADLLTFPLKTSQI